MSISDLTMIQLTNAVRKGDEETVLSLLLPPEKLLDRGADVKIQNDFGDTPLMYAIRYSQASMVSLLLNRGEILNIKLH